MTFLREPDPSPEVQELYDGDLSSYGFVMNLTHLWAHLPAAQAQLFDLIGLVGQGLSLRERGILVAATASTIGDSYCSLAWGWKLSAEAGAELAAGVLTGTDEGLTQREQALAAWARRVAGTSGPTTEADVEGLRRAGWADDEIFRATTFVALRIAFSTVNGALGARPDAELRGLAPAAVLDAVTWGRPLE